MPLASIHPFRELASKTPRDAIRQAIIGAVPGRPEAPILVRF
jgi:hypothetical protein